MYCKSNNIIFTSISILSGIGLLKMTIKYYVNNSNMSIYLCLLKTLYYVSVSIKVTCQKSRITTNLKFIMNIMFKF